jgi:uncharacterized protein (TIGR03000 family)
MTDRAQLVVQLPESAKLFVDDHLMSTTSERRVFNTPVLQQGQTYYYIVRAEMDRDGMTYSSSKRVIIRPGDVVQTSFTDVELTQIKAPDDRATAQR